MCQKCEDMGLNGFTSKELNKKYKREKNILGAIWDLPDK